MLDKYSDVFENKLGSFTSAKAKLTLKDDSQARFLKARPMPYALKRKVEEELRRLQNEGILTKVEWSGVNGPHRLCLSPRKMVPSDFVVITRSQ